MSNPWSVRRCSGGMSLKPGHWCSSEGEILMMELSRLNWHASASTESSRSTSREKGCHHLQEYSILEKYSNVFDNIFKVYKLYYIDANTLNI